MEMAITSTENTIVRVVRIAAAALMGVAVVSARHIPEAPPPDVRIPICPGTTIVTAVSQPDGDYESIKTVESVNDRAVSLRYSSERKVRGTLERLKLQRTVRVEDMRGATSYMHHFNNKGAITVPGTTAIGTSGRVLHELKTSGVADLGIFDPVGSGSSVDRKVHPNVYDYQMVEKIRRVGSGRVLVHVIVNDVAVALPTIEARGDYTGDKADFFFLDDEANPIALRYRIGRDSLDVVKIFYRCDPNSAGQAAVRSRLEQSLMETGRADVYSIYFSFNSDQLRDESDSTLKDIDDVLKRHPDWKLAINGHTDSVGGDQYNLDLSGRRAASVKDALVKRYGASAARLSTAGYGKRSPKEPNETLEGRARNRRVELVRTS
jgi:outer membrane protein OmpA-like peptidoglycan-associated protein